MGHAPPILTAPGSLATEVAPVSMREGSSAKLLFILALIQFLHVLDFVIMMPLGPQFMRVFDIGPQKFGMLVSVYSLSAAAATLIGAFFLDRWDRKSTLLVILAGMTVGTIGCALAVGPASLLAARMVAGCFGGVVQAVLIAIVGDSFSDDKRGAATGTVMSAFSFASIAGIPFGLYLADAHGWRAPFYLLSLMSIGAWYLAWRALPPIRSHITVRREVLGPTLKLMRERNSLVAFGLIASLMFAGFMVIPFMSTYLVMNVGLSESDLATVFLAAGAATLLTSRLSGLLADRFGKVRVFTWLALASALPTLLLTHLGTASVAAAVAVSTFLTVMISARAIPALALITTSIDRTRRGSFLSLTSSVQQIASGLASLAAGAILWVDGGGLLQGYELVGNLACAAILLAVIAARSLDSAHR